MVKTGPAEGYAGPGCSSGRAGDTRPAEAAIFYWRCQTRVRLAVAPCGPVRVTVQAGLPGS